MGALHVSRALLALSILGLFLVAIQLDILAGLRVAGVVVMVIWLWPFCIAIVGQAAAAVASGVVLGLLFDAHTSTPYGLTAIVGGLIALGSIRLAREGVGDLEGAAWWMTPLLAAVVGFFAPLLFVLTGIFALDFSLWHGSLVASMLVNAVFFALLARPIARLVAFTSGTSRRRR